MDADQPKPTTDLDRELVGFVWVDSGQLVVTDPNYLEELDAETIAAATNLKSRAALLLDGMAAAFRVGIRNGRYPIYAHKYPNGALARIEIELDERRE
jgi:hypothetical protein